MPNIVLSTITIISLLIYLFGKKPSRNIIFISIAMIVLLCANIAFRVTFHQSFGTLDQKNAQKSTKSTPSTATSEYQEEVTKQTYNIVDTDQQSCYGETSAISCPTVSE